MIGVQFAQEFIQIPLEQLHREAALKKAEGWRFIQTHAVKTDDGVDLFYSFMKDGTIENLKVVAVQPDQPVPSVTDLFLAAFVFENEARELFGIDMRDIAIDFAGAMYAPALSEPMTILSPEMKAARDKARKAQAAKDAKDTAPAQEGAAEGAAPASAGKHVFVMTPERRARLDAKLATMSPEKVAKVEAALKAREAEAAAAASGAAPAVEAAPEKATPVQAAPVASEAPASNAVATTQEPKRDVQLEHALELLGKDKAEKVRAAISMRAGGEAPAAQIDTVSSTIDADLQAKIALLDDDKAAKVRAAIAAKAARDASSKGGE